MVWTSPGMVVKVSWLPASLGSVLGFVGAMREHGTDVEVSGRAAIGSGRSASTAMSRQARSGGANALAAGPLDTSPYPSGTDEQTIDVWIVGPAALWRAVKHALGTQALMNAGRGPV